MHIYIYRIYINIRVYLFLYRCAYIHTDISKFQRNTNQKPFIFGRALPLVAVAVRQRSQILPSTVESLPNGSPRATFPQQSVYSD